MKRYTIRERLEDIVDNWGPLFDSDDDVNGGDLVQAFGDWLPGARAALADEPASVPSWQYDAVLAELDEKTRYARDLYAAANAPRTVYSLVLYYGSNGDEVQVFTSEAERDAAALAYAVDHWAEECECNNAHTCTPTLPTSIDDAEDRMDFDSCDCRWERFEHTLTFSTD